MLLLNKEFRENNSMRILITIGLFIGIVAISAGIAIDEGLQHGLLFGGVTLIILCLFYFSER